MRIASSMTNIAVLQLHGFGCEMPIWGNFGVCFGGFWPLKLWNYCCDPQRYKRFEILHIKIGSAVSSVALFKYQHYVKNNRKVSGRSPKGNILPKWGEAPNLNVTKFCMWLPFPDVIICARFYFYRLLIFRGAADPRKLAALIDLKDDLYNS